MMMRHPDGSDTPPEAAERRVALRVRLLGGFEVAVGDRVIPDFTWRTQKARNLFKILCLAPDHQLHREQIIDFLWPELAPEAAAGNLRSTLHAVRRALEPERASGAESSLTLRRDVLRLDPADGLAVDVEAFAAAAAEAHRLQRSDTFRTAVERYTGDLLPGDRYEDWAAAPRESLRETWLGLLLSLAHLHESRGEYAPGIAALERAVAADVTHEDAHVGLMRLYAQSTRHGQALRQYERLREALARELDVEPSAASQRLHAEIAAGSFPQANILSPSTAEMQPAPRQHNLPAPLTSFIGRRREIGEVDRLLRTTRLMTLTGVGGAGKSRLAIELARELVDEYPDGAWLAELAPLADPALAPAAVAAAVGVREQPGHTLTETIVDALQTRSLLLVLDNCEHLIDACAGLVETLLMACPELRILATSREALRVPGEVNWRVPPLSLPPPQPDAPPGHARDPEHMLKNEAIALFVDRVRWVRPGFVLTDGNASAVAQICRRLDGLPLALELAAARASVLAPEQLATRLDNALGLLSGGSRTATSRQQTLRATLDWSYALLDERERTLFRRLAVFAGGWSLEMVEAICAGQGEGNQAGVEGAEVLAVLANLVDKSLVQVEEAPAGASGVRYRLLETVRQHAVEQLSASGELKRLRNQHGDYYMALAEEAEPWLTGPDQSVWIGRLEREHDNLRAALSWSSESGEIEREARMCVALLRLWDFLGYYIEGERWIADALARGDGNTTPLLLRARLLQSAALLAWRQGDPARSGELSRKSLPLFQEAGDQHYLAGTFHNLGTVAELQGNYAEASHHYEEALRLREEVGDTPGVARSLHNLGNLAREQGELDGATTLYERELALQREIGSRLGIALALSGLGVVALDKGDYALSVEVSMESHNLYQELGSKSLNAMVLQNLGFATMNLGEHARSVEFQNHCLRLTVENGDKRGIACGLEGVAAAIALFDTSPQSAERSARIFGAADALRAELNVPLPPADFALMECSMTSARNTLGEEAFNAAWAVGKELPLEKVVAEALDATDPRAISQGQPVVISAPVSLSRREREVAALIAQGHTNTEIAAVLGMARPTADKHVSNILRKLGFSSRSDVSAWAIKHDLAPDDTVPAP